MKKFRIEFLGDKQICLEKSDNTVNDRINICNEFIKLVAGSDRQFFYRKETNNVSRFELQNDKLVFYDHYTNEPIKNTSNSDKYKWKGNFNGGGTLQDLVMCMSIYIESGIPFFIWWARMEHWGYTDESIDSFRKFGLEKGLFTDKKRYMFYLRGNPVMSITEFINKNESFDINKCITVETKYGKGEPYWVGEFNFIYQSYS